MSDDKRSAGNLSRLGGASPAVEVDCSRWPRNSAVPRSSGKLVRVAHAAPVPSLPQHDGVGATMSLRLEVVVGFSANLPPTQVWHEINRLMQAMSAAAPDLKLTYDALRSRTENGDVVIALTPKDPKATSERLDVLSDALYASAGEHLKVHGIRMAA